MEETMQQPQTVFSRRVPCGKNRSYFFDVRLAQNGNKYLAITESRAIDGIWKSYKILVFKDRLTDWQSGLSEAIEQLGIE